MGKFVRFFMMALGVVAILDFVVMPLVYGLSPSTQSEWRKTGAPPAHTEDR